MPNQSGTWTLSQQFQARGQGLWPVKPGAPTIGTATAGGSLCASVAFTAPACAGYPATISSYTVTSTPGCFTGTGTSSPVTVSGLTFGTSYTFKVRAQNASGLTSACSGSSNSITATIKGQVAYTTPGTYSWVAPTGVTSVSVVAVGGGGGGGCINSYQGGGGGLGWKNNIAVTPGTSYTVVVGAGAPNNGSGGKSYFISCGLVSGLGGIRPNGGGRVGDGGGVGGCGGYTISTWGGAGGAGGYSGGGGYGGYNGCLAGPGYGGAGGGARYYGRGGGVGLLGEGASGNAGTFYGYGGSGGQNGDPALGTCVAGYYGAGGGNNGGINTGAPGAVRIIWPGNTRLFPSTNTGNL